MGLYEVINLHRIQCIRMPNHQDVDGWKFLLNPNRKLAMVLNSLSPSLEPTHTIKFGSNIRFCMYTHIRTSCISILPLDSESDKPTPSSLLIKVLNDEG